MLLTKLRWVSIQFQFERENMSSVWFRREYFTNDYTTNLIMQSLLEPTHQMIQPEITRQPQTLKHQQTDNNLVINSNH